MHNTTTPRSLFVMSIGLGLGLAACAEEPASPAPVDQDLRIDQHDDRVVRGAYDAGELAVEFVAESSREAAGTVTVRVGDDVLVLTADAITGEVAVDAAGARLDADEAGALASFALAIEAYLGDADDVSRFHEGLLAGASTYLAVAPVDATLPDSFHMVEGLKGTAPGTGNDGKTCVARGSTRTATFDGSQGVRSESWVVGANGGVQWNGDFAGMGRCGVGTGSYDWTLDCLEHDACSRYYYSSTGLADHNCGDEWSEASDDYTAFWKRCY